MSELKILSLHVKEDYLDLSNVVLEVVWNLSQILPYKGPNGDDIIISVGDVSILDDPNPETYTEFDNLSEDIVKNWIIATKEYKNKELELEKEYRSRTISNVIVKDPPWMTN